MSDAAIVPEDPQSTPPVDPAPPPRRARSHVGRLILLILALIVAGVGFYARSTVPPGGTVTAIKLTTKPDIAGQARDAYDSIVPTTADLYLIVKSPGGRAEKTDTFKDTPIGSGLTWTLSPPRDLREIELVEIWDRRRLIGDKQLDRIAFPPDAWVARGQTFELTAQGTRREPPPWAMPVAYAGATLAGLLLLRLVWDQAL